MSETYNVRMRTKQFSLTRSQIEFDSPNYFTACFLGEFHEAATKSVTLDRNPDLFTILVEYLNGYSILPMSENALPPSMSPEAAFRNLLADVQFYGFSRLETAMISPAPVNVGWHDFHDKVALWEDIMDGELPDGVTWSALGLNYNINSTLPITTSVPKPVLVAARNVKLTLQGMYRSAQYRISLDNNQAEGLESLKPYVLPTLPDGSSLIAGSYPDSVLQIDGKICRFNHFAQWFYYHRKHLDHDKNPVINQQWYHIFEDAFPGSFGSGNFEPGAEAELFPLQADQILFIITGNKTSNLPEEGIANKLAVTILNAKARTRASLLQAITL